MADETRREVVAASGRTLVSVVIPCYRSEATIGKVVHLTMAELDRLGYDSEFVLVNDCSPDGTFAAMAGLAAQGLPVTCVDFAKNFGQHAALMAGLRGVSGEVVLLMDDDMQTHPSQIGRLLDRLSDPGVDVVFGRYPERREAAWRRAGSAFARWSLRVLAGVPRDLVPSSFVAMRRCIAEAMVAYEGPYPYVTGLIFQSSSRVVDEPVEHFEREVGTSGYTLRGLVRLWSTILNFSMVPLRVATVTGALMGAAGLALALALAVRKLLVPQTPMGWSSTMVAILVCSGLIVLFLGVVGEYVGRAFMSANNAPQYVVRETISAREG